MRVYSAYLLGVLLAVSAILNSCRSKVFENRVDCDATVCFKSPAGNPILSANGKAIYFRLFDDGIIGESSTVSPDALNKGILYMRPKKSFLRWSALMNWPGDERYWKGGRLVVPEGEDFPKAYADYLSFELTDADYQECIVDMCPLYTVVECDLTGVTFIDVEISSAFGGYRDPDLTVDAGVYKRTYHLNESSSFNIPSIVLNDCTVTLKTVSRQFVLDSKALFAESGIQASDIESSLVSLAFSIKDAGSCKVVLSFADSIIKKTL